MGTKITSPVPDFTGKVAGVQFVDGSAETDDEGALGYFARHGYGVAGSDVEGTKAYPKGAPTIAWSIAQLKAYCEDKGLVYGTAKTKADYLLIVSTPGTTQRLDVLGDKTHTGPNGADISGSGDAAQGSDGDSHLGDGSDGAIGAAPSTAHAAGDDENATGA